MKIEERIDLQSLNTLAVPSRARFFARATNEQELRQALRWAAKHSIPLSILGGGSNSLLPEQIPGLVIQPSLRGINLQAESERHYQICAAAGENWHRFVMFCLAKNYYGLENLASIPGSVGAAPIQNIGAYGVELQDIFVSLRAMHRKSCEVRTFSREECQFGYRDSVFKNELKDQYVVLDVTFKLAKHADIKADYPALKTALTGVRRAMITPNIIAHTVSSIRKEKLPDPAVIPNCGSFFKNPVVDSHLIESLKELYPDLVYFDLGDQKNKVAAGWLIEKSGWKGKEAFEACVHDQQALVLTNPHRKPAKNIMKLAGAIQSSIRQRYGIELEQEPQWLKPGS